MGFLKHVDTIRSPRNKNTLSTLLLNLENINEIDDGKGCDSENDASNKLNNVIETLSDNEWNTRSLTGLMMLSDKLSFLKWYWC